MNAVEAGQGAVADRLASVNLWLKSVWARAAMISGLKPSLNQTKLI